jgi:hypothetical protein
VVEFVEKRSHQFLMALVPALCVFAGLWSPLLQGSLLSDSFLGFSRSALQDASPTWDNSDPYQSVGNPAWFAAQSEVSVVYSITEASLGDRAQKEDATQLLVLSLIKNYSSLSFGGLAFMPVSGQPLLDTGNVEERSSPWMNMNRQLLYAGHAAYRPHGSDFSVGLLLPLYFDAQAMATSRLATSDVNSRAQVRLIPRLSLGLGFSYENLWSPGWGMSVYYKERSRARAQASIEGNIPLLSLDLLFKGESFYSFDPRRLSVNLFHRDAQSVWGLRVRFSNWAEYQTPYVRLTDSSLVLSDRIPPGRSHNKWDFALSWDQALSPTSSFSASMGYRPTPFKSVPSFFDADHYILGAGYRQKMSEDWDFAGSLRVHILGSGQFYTWAGLGVGYSL